jgi:hypothetical protein
MLGSGHMFPDRRHLSPGSTDSTKEDTGGDVRRIGRIDLLECPHSRQQTIDRPRAYDLADAKFIRSAPLSPRTNLEAAGEANAQLAFSR